MENIEDELVINISGGVKKKKGKLKKLKSFHLN